VRLLRERETKREFVEHLLDGALAHSRMDPADKGLLQELVYGVVRWQGTLDHLIARKTGGRPQKPVLQILLRLALYQIFWLSRIPDHAAVNETVELAKREGFSTQAGFVNAVLRGYLREREQTERMLAELKESNPALGYSHPAWLCDRWAGRMAREELIRLLAWNNTPPATFARVNTLRTDADSLREQWAHERIEARLVPVEWDPKAMVFELTAFPPLASLPSFLQGKFYVQDPSTLLAVSELDPQPGETVLDLCAAPGGKTTLMAARMKNEGCVVAHDPASDRLRLVEENCARLGVTCVRLSEHVEEPGASFDRILLDAPCSNTGVMRRRVDLRWRIREPELTRLRETQRQLLERAVPLLKPGGTLVYSTCSLEPEENSGLIRDFLGGHPAMQLQKERALTPWENGVDGAYVARLVSGG